MWTRPAAYIWKWDERHRWWWWRITKLGMIIQVLGYRHCSPKLLGCHNLSITLLHLSY